MHFWWVFLFLTSKSVAEQSGSDSTNNGGIFQVEMATKNIGRIKYQDGEVVIAQNQQRHADFFFTPFPYLQSEETQCYENVLNDRIELGLQVELYTPQLIRTVKEYLHKYKSSLCGNTTSTFVCDVSLLPMHSIRLVQKSSRPASTSQKYTLDESWQSATLLLQSMEFIMYASNMTACEQLRKTLVEKCRLPNFEVQYSLHGQYTAQRQLEVNTEHVASTNMYNQIRAQFPSTDTVVLTGNDFKELLSESTDRITMTLRMQEGFENLQDPMTIDKILEQQLSTRQIQLQLINDKLWENLYWTSELTRPDRLAKVLNSVLRKESGDSERFIYDRQAAKNAMTMDLTQHNVFGTDMTEHNVAEVDQSNQDVDRVNLHQHDNDNFNSVNQNLNRVHLARHDKQRLGQFDKLFDSHSRSASSSNAQTSNDNAGGGLNVFGLFSIGGNYGGASQSQSQSANNQADVSQRNHQKVSDVDNLNVTSTDTRDLNIYGIGRNHLNRTQIDKERFTNAQTNDNNFNQVGYNTNDLNATKIDTNVDKQYTTTRNGVEKFLRQMFNNVHLEGDMIKPRPINARLVKIGKLSTNTKLSSNTVLVRMRSNVHALPLRCRTSNNSGKSKLWLTDRIDQVETMLLNLSSFATITKLHNEITNLQEKMNHVGKNLTDMIKQDIKTTFNRVNVSINNLDTSIMNKMNHLGKNLTDIMKQDISTTFSRINVSTDNLDTSIMNRMNLKMNHLGKNLTDMMKQDISVISNRINARMDFIDNQLIRTNSKSQ